MTLVGLTVDGIAILIVAVVELLALHVGNLELTATTARVEPVVDL